MKQEKTFTPPKKRNDKMKTVYIWLLKYQKLLTGLDGRGYF